jgi:hypothetical protein
MLAHPRVKHRAFGAPERLLGLDCSAWSSKLLTGNAGLNRQALR